MLINLGELSTNRVYHTMIQSVVPRPVAWVLSDNGDGGYNLAPFSYFNAICSKPPLILLSIGKKPEGELKDSRVNIRDRGHFVVHIAHRELAERVTATSAPLPHGASEQQREALALTDFGDFTLPRLRDCRIAMACQLYRYEEIGAQGLIFGEVSQIHLDDSIASRDEKDRVHVDTAALDPIARLGGDNYGLLGEIITIPRPK